MDIIQGDNNDNILDGTALDDTIWGHGGDDTLSGGGKGRLEGGTSTMAGKAMTPSLVAQVKTFGMVKPNHFATLSAGLALTSADFFVI